MRIDRRLNLVVTVERDEGGSLYVHSTPVQREVFEANFLPLSKTYARIWQEGLVVVSGPRVAMMMLEKVSRDMRVWDGPDGVQAAFVEEVRRLTNVVMSTSTGWTTVPLHTAVQKEMLSADELSEVEGQVCFFILVSAVSRRRDVASAMAAMSDLWGTQTTLLNSTEYASFLTTSDVAGSTGANPAAVAASVPF